MSGLIPGKVVHDQLVLCHLQVNNRVRFQVYLLGIVDDNRGKNLTISWYSSICESLIKLGITYLHLLEYRLMDVDVWRLKRTFRRR